jgi:hypothetical protein
MGIAYRIRQFWRAVTARRLSVEEWREIEKILTPAEGELFRLLARADQAHSYRVMKTLSGGAPQSRALLVAALLHDVGKTRVRLPLWLRPAIILGQALFPGRVKEWGQADPTGWRRPFVIKARHPEWGAQMALAAGSEPLTIALIRRHQDLVGAADGTAEDSLLRRLQRADDDN